MKDKNGRFHTILSNAPKELRNYLSTNGERFIEIDITSTQPLQLLYVLKNYQYNTLKIKSLLTPANHEKLKALSMLYGSGELHDVKKYESDIIQGRIYEVLNPGIAGLMLWACQVSNLRPTDYESSNY
ncbi:MAG: hypothetical protein KFF73_20810 [Cyclobacteriaceae bacterium]|nr:hypothetical protein [Cyclobacteriaceae bacterium]